ncbi:hypothetical protein WN55_01102 [Dufourea novaeangliae]|uniref:Uncharacterized protein n=1 Tax=Dufourea novaeangliae TaxID=178035 RepID=A0A154PE22_DUFNO|nr:hypothetical protein WN55_01102 [Dufourea novaeangliae]
MEGLATAQVSGRQSESHTIFAKLSALPEPCPRPTDLQSGVTVMLQHRGHYEKPTRLVWKATECSPFTRFARARREIV